MIGIFDSGVGGLSVVKQLFSKLPKYQIVYYGDTAHFPYGSKSPNLIKQYSGEIVNFLLKKGAKIIIIACHTSSSLAEDFLKNKFKDLPIFSMTKVTYEDAINKEIKRIGIIGTQATIASGTYEKKLKTSNKNKDLEVYSKACPLFAPLVEEGMIEKKEISLITKRYLKDLKDANIEAIILGCTHYPALENFIGDFMGKKVRIINPAKNLIQFLEMFLDENPAIEKKLKKGLKHKFYVSDNPEAFKKSSIFFLGKPIEAKMIKLKSQ